MRMTLLMLTWTQKVGMTNHTSAGKPQENETNAGVVTEETLHTQALNIRTVPMKSEIVMNQKTLALIEELHQAFSKQQLVRTEPIQKNEILLKIQSTFAKGDPRAWWSSLISKPKIHTFEDNTGHLHLGELTPSPVENVWLIADEDNEEKLLFCLPLKTIPSILEECRYFEYYIVDKQLSWMISENDHGDLIFCNAPASHETHE